MDLLGQRYTVFSMGGGWFCRRATTQAFRLLLSSSLKVNKQTCQRKLHRADT